MTLLPGRSKAKQAKKAAKKEAKRAEKLVRLERSSDRGARRNLAALRSDDVLTGEQLQAEKTRHLG
jgi:hypothetical protein